MNAEELRETLAPYEKVDGEFKWMRADTDGKSWTSSSKGEYPTDWMPDPILEAARRWLLVLDGGEELVEHIALALWRNETDHHLVPWSDLEPADQGYYFDEARAVIAALIPVDAQ